MGYSNPEELPQREFDTVATFAAHQLELLGFTYCHLTPGDGTKYEIAIVHPPTNEEWDRFIRRSHLPPSHVAHEAKPALNGDDYWVSHSIRGALYPWHGDEVHWTYAYEKWTSMNGGTDRWTAVVIARFLSALSVEITNRKENAS